MVKTPPVYRTRALVNRQRLEIAHHKQNTAPLHSPKRIVRRLWSTLRGQTGRAAGITVRRPDGDSKTVSHGTDTKVANNGRHDLVEVVDARHQTSNIVTDGESGSVDLALKLADGENGSRFAFVCSMGEVRCQIPSVQAVKTSTDN